MSRDAATAAPARAWPAEARKASAARGGTAKVRSAARLGSNRQAGAEGAAAARGRGEGEVREGMVAWCAVGLMLSAVGYGAGQEGVGARGCVEN
jgi:hypothetical protein